MITKREAIRETKRLWKEIEKSGLSKIIFLYHSEAGKKWLNKGYRAYCPLCQYIAKFPIDGTTRCICCPLVVQGFKKCIVLGFADCPPSPAIFKAIKALKD